MTSKNNALSLLARNLDATGDVTTDAIASTVSFGVDVYDSIGSLPYVGNTSGDQAFVSSTNRLYIWQGSGWYSIALINRAPTISSVQDSDGGTTPFTLSSDGDVTRITITAADSDGDPITYSATADSDFSGLATISQADNIFTVTPFSQDSATTESGTITFKATDGINISSDVNTFTLTFAPDWTASTQQAKIQASDAEASDQFGYSVAIDGDTAIVGARVEDTGATNAGAAYIFTRSGSTWTQQQKIQASDAQASDQFGNSVAIDGDTVIVGAYQEDTGATDAGAAYIFTRSGSTWTQQAKIQSSDIEASDWFAEAADISGDTVIVGARLEDAGGTSAGAAYIFTRSGSTWTQQAKIQSSDIEASDQFGYSVAIDGDTVIVGALRESTGASQAGAAYVFTRSGSTWTQQAKIQASDAEATDQFGYSVAIDGDTAIVGAKLEDTGGTSAGSAYIFYRDGSTWTQQAKIQASDAEANDQFAEAVDISGNTVIVGAYQEDTGATDAGAAYIFVAG